MFHFEIFLSYLNTNLALNDREKFIFSNSLRRQLHCILSVLFFDAHFWSPLSSNIVCEKYLFPSFPDEKKQYDPTGFRDSILEGLEASGNDLEAVTKFLDVSGSKLDYRRYGVNLIEILIAGGLLGVYRLGTCRQFAGNAENYRQICYNREPESKHCSTLRVEHGRNGSARAA